MQRLRYNHFKKMSKKKAVDLDKCKTGIAVIKDFDGKKEAIKNLLTRPH
jgi:hypothetical protein